MYQLSKISALIIGLIISLLFIIFGGAIYQLLYLGNPMFTENLFDFRDLLRSKSWTINLSIITVAIPWAMAIIYYYVINSVHFDRWWHWCIVWVIISPVTAIIGYKYLTMSMNSLEPGLAFAYEDLNSILAVWNCLLSGLFFIIASYSCRWWSNNCRHTPIPQ